MIYSLVDFRFSYKHCYSQAVAYLSRWLPKPWQGPFTLHSLVTVVLDYKTRDPTPGGGVEGKGNVWGEDIPLI